VNLENNIIYSASITPGSVCTYSHNILSPPENLGGTNRDVDPRFLNLSQKDFRLAADSPAIDTAMPSVALPATLDFLGVTRPQGSRPDIGAYERKP
jgi:hypothetical protein